MLEVAPQLLGQHLVRKGANGICSTYVITETEAYRGEEDLACHASKGHTPRTEVMFGEGGHILYVSDLWNVLDDECGHRP